MGRSYQSASPWGCVCAGKGEASAEARNADLRTKSLRVVFMDSLAKDWGQFIIWILLHPPVSRQNRSGRARCTLWKGSPRISVMAPRGGEPVSHRRVRNRPCLGNQEKGWAKEE